MRRLLGYCLARASAVGNRVFDEHIGTPLALRRVDYTILVLVDANPHATNRQLARLLDLSMPYLTITLDKLAARGLVTRTRSEADRRSSLLRLTDAGRSLLGEAEAIAATMRDGLTSPTRMLSETSIASMTVVRDHGSVILTAGRAAAKKRSEQATRSSAGGMWRRHVRRSAAARTTSRLL